MNPAWSMTFFTTLAGAGQGLETSRRGEALPIIAQLGQQSWG